MKDYKVEVLEEICKGCALCVTACPKNLFKVSSKINAKGYNPAEWVGHPVFLDEEKLKEFGKEEKYGCVGCGVCYDVCPEAAIKICKKGLGVKVIEDGQ